jgi:lipopolysaccharide transport system permease protein
MNGTEAEIETPLLVIGPARGWAPLRLGELWEYRDLLLFLAWRDLQVRYRQTVLGVVWALLQPLLTMIVFAIFFGALAQVPSAGVPYPLFAYSALVPWTYFANALVHSSNSLVEQERILSKVYFPRLLLPMTPVIIGIVDMVLPILLLLAMALFYGYTPTPKILMLPFFVLFAAATAFATGIWLSALNVYYRDIRYAIPFVVQLWLFITPIAYPSSLVPERWRLIYALNPMASVVEGFRWAIVPNMSPPGPLFIVALSMVVVILVSGLHYFRRLEKSFADVV